MKYPLKRPKIPWSALKWDLFTPLRCKWYQFDEFENLNNTGNMLWSNLVFELSSHRFQLSQLVEVLSKATAYRTWCTMWILKSQWFILTQLLEVLKQRKSYQTWCTLWMPIKSMLTLVRPFTLRKWTDFGSCSIHSAQLFSSVC